MGSSFFMPVLCLDWPLGFEPAVNQLMPTLLCSVVIRPMAPDDLPAVAAIEKKVQYAPWSQAQFEQSLKAGHQCWVLMDQQGLQGYAVMQTVADEASLLIMAVDPAHQGLGFGRELLAQALIRLPPQTQMVFLEVRASNVAAIRLYDRLGFVEAGIRKNYYPSAQGQEDARVMVLTLGNPFAQP